MKSEQEINEAITNGQNNLVYAEGENVIQMQGFIRALKWVLAEEEKND